MTQTNKEISFGHDAIDKVKKGVDLVCNAVKVTLGPAGKTVLIENPVKKPQATKDGVTVATHINVSDNYENLGAEIAKEASSKTNDKAGDGTTTTCVILQDIFNSADKLVKAGYKPREIRKGLLSAKNELLEKLNKSATKIRNEEDLVRVATISANDSEIGEIVGKTVYQMGKDALVTLGAHDKIGIEVEKVKGLSIASGMANGMFMTDRRRLESVMDDCHVLVTDKRITLLPDIMPLLERLAQENINNLVIFAEAVEGAVLATLIKNKMSGTYNSLAINAPESGERRRDILQDIATITGATFISDEMGAKISEVDKDDLGSAESISAGLNETVIIGGGGKKEKVKERIDYIESCIENAKTDYERKPYQDRLAKIQGGVAVVRVGCATDTEKQETFQRTEDAIHASKAALTSGIIAGGGYGLMTVADELKRKQGDIGRDLLIDACSSPMRQIADNSGKSGDVVVMESKRLKLGYNAMTEEYGDMIEMGIIDPVIVTANAIENAVSASIALITSGCVIVHDDDKGDEKA